MAESRTPSAARTGSKLEPQAPGAGDRGFGPAPLGDAVKRYLKAAGLTSRKKDGEVFAAWDHAVGPDLARQLRATTFRQGTLTVEVPSSSQLQELRGFTGDGYKTAANAQLSRPLIRRVKFRLRSSS